MRQLPLRQLQPPPTKALLRQAAQPAGPMAWAACSSGGGQHLRRRRSPHGASRASQAAGPALLQPEQAPCLPSPRAPRGPRAQRVPSIGRAALQAWEGWTSLACRQLCGGQAHFASSPAPWTLLP